MADQVMARRVCKRVAATARYHAVLIMLCLILLYPLIWMITGAFKTSSEIIQSPNLLPDEWILSNFTTGWFSLTGLTFGSYFLTSGIVAGLSVMGNLISCSLAAFAFARLKFPLHRILFAIMLMTIMLPAQVRAIPEYIIFNQLGWIDTILPLVVPKFLAVDAFFIYLMTEFIRGLPRTYDEAARVDGCTTWGVFWRVILPLMKPGLVTAGLLTFIWTYDDFFNQLIYLTSPQSYTVPLGLSLFINAEDSSTYGPLFAMGLLSLVPVTLLFAVFQRHLVEGLHTGGIRG